MANRRQWGDLCQQVSMTIPCMYGYGYMSVRAARSGCAYRKSLFNSRNNPQLNPTRKSRCKPLAEGRLSFLVPLNVRGALPYFGSLTFKSIADSIACYMGPFCLFSSNLLTPPGYCRPGGYFCLSRSVDCFGFLRIFSI